MLAYKNKMPDVTLVKLKHQTYPNPELKCSRTLMIYSTCISIYSAERYSHQCSCSQHIMISFQHPRILSGGIFKKGGPKDEQVNGLVELGFFNLFSQFDLNEKYIVYFNNMNTQQWRSLKVAVIEKFGSFNSSKFHFAVGFFFVEV